jgi:hypothetical protein
MRKRGESLADQFIEDSYHVTRHFSTEAKHRNSELGGSRVPLEKVHRLLDLSFMKIV